MLHQRLLMSLAGLPSDNGNGGGIGGANKSLGRLAQAMSRRRPGDAKYARLAALPFYGEPQFAGDRDRVNGSGQTSNSSAYQDTAFQNDAYQV